MKNRCCGLSAVCYKRFTEQVNTLLYVVIPSSPAVVVVVGFHSSVALCIKQYFDDPLCPIIISVELSTLELLLANGFTH